jgi:hypothetical protein
MIYLFVLNVKYIVVKQFFNCQWSYRDLPINFFEFFKVNLSHLLDEPSFILFFTYMPLRAARAVF